MAYVPIDIRFKLITLQDLIYATFTVNGSTAGGVWIDTRCAHHLETCKNGAAPLLLRGNAACGCNRAISPLDLMKLSSARCGCEAGKVRSTAIDLIHLRGN